MDYAIKVLHADYIATGHYCQRSFNLPHAHLLRGADGNKDQSYFLHAIEHNVLEKVLFPVGHLEKPLVRAMAAERGLATATQRTPPAFVLSVKNASVSSYHNIYHLKKVLLRL